MGKIWSSPVFGDETTVSVFDPFVVMIEDRYRLFVSERKNSGIICTDSTDGTEWEKWKVALEAGDKGSWEERVNRASVCEIDGKWLMCTLDKVEIIVTIASPQVMMHSIYKNATKTNSCSE